MGMSGPSRRPVYKSIGERRLRASLQSATEVVDALGGRSQTWSTYATAFVSVSPQPFVVSETQAAVIFVVEMPYRSDVAVQHRIVVNGQTLKVIALVNPEFRNRALQAHCAEL